MVSMQNKREHFTVFCLKKNTHTHTYGASKLSNKNHAQKEMLLTFCLTGLVATAVLMEP